jgi:hypothetical protein
VTSTREPSLVRAPTAPSSRQPPSAFPRRPRPGWPRQTSYTRPHATPGVPPPHTEQPAVGDVGHAAVGAVDRTVVEGPHVALATVADTVRGDAGPGDVGGVSLAVVRTARHRAVRRTRTVAVKAAGNAAVGGTSHTGSMGAWSWRPLGQAAMEVARNTDAVAHAVVEHHAAGRAALWIPRWTNSMNRTGHPSC